MAAALVVWGHPVVYSKWEPLMLSMINQRPKGNAVESLQPISCRGWTREQSTRIIINALYTRTNQSSFMVISEWQENNYHNK